MARTSTRTSTRSCKWMLSESLISQDALGKKIHLWECHLWGNSSSTDFKCRIDIRNLSQRYCHPTLVSQEEGAGILRPLKDQAQLEGISSLGRVKRGHTMKLGRKAAPVGGKKAAKRRMLVLRLLQDDSRRCLNDRRIAWAGHEPQSWPQMCEDCWWCCTKEMCG